MLISIDICDDIICLTQGSVSSGNVEVRNFAQAKLPDGAVEDGDIKNKAALSAAIAKLLGAKGFRPLPVAATFTSSLVVSRRLTLPPGKPSEISAMVKSQMSQSVNYPESCAFEYVPAKPLQAKNSPCDIWAYALDRDFIDRYCAVIKGAKLRPAALDVHPNCIEKLVSGAQINGIGLGGRSTLFADIERDFMEIHLFCENERVFSRIAPVSASEFLLIADNLGYGRSEFDLGPKEAAPPSEPGGKKKRSDFIAYDSLDISPEALAKDSILADAARQYAGRLSDELLKMIQFQMMRNSSMPISCAYIFGSFSTIKGLSGIISQLLSCPVETVESISKVRTDADVKLAKYMNAIGALIRLK